MKNRLQNYIDILLKGDEESSLLAVSVLKEDAELLNTMKEKEAAAIYDSFMYILSKYKYNDPIWLRIFDETDMARYLTIFLQTLNEQN